MKKNKLILLPVIIVCYAFMFIATTKKERCFDDCQKLRELGNTLTKNRSYIYGPFRCASQTVGDTLCIYVKDTTGIDWNLLADTVCIIATEKGLPRQKVFILKNSVTPPDTLARKQCP